jgi:hypothetical protein
MFQYIPTATGACMQLAERAFHQLIPASVVSFNDRSVKNQFRDGVLPALGSKAYFNLPNRSCMRPSQARNDSAASPIQFFCMKMYFSSLPVPFQSHTSLYLEGSKGTEGSFFLSLVWVVSKAFFTGEYHFFRSNMPARQVQSVLSLYAAS